MDILVVEVQLDRRLQRVALVLQECRRCWHHPQGCCERCGFKPLLDGPRLNCYFEDLLRAMMILMSIYYDNGIFCKDIMECRSCIGDIICMTICCIVFVLPGRLALRYYRGSTKVGS